MKKTLITTALILGMAMAAFAHGDMVHIMGTVTGTTDHSITVKTTSGDTQTVEVAKETKITKGDAAVSMTDVHVGDRVAIHAAKHDDKLRAEAIKIGTSETK